MEGKRNNPQGMGKLWWVGGWVGGKNFLNKFAARVLTVNGGAYNTISHNMRNYLD